MNIFENYSHGALHFASTTFVVYVEIQYWMMTCQVYIYYAYTKCLYILWRILTFKQRPFSII